jgi:hypothetical protein
LYLSGCQTTLSDTSASIDTSPKKKCAGESTYQGPKTLVEFHKNEKRYSFYSGMGEYVQKKLDRLADAETRLDVIGVRWSPVESGEVFSEWVSIGTAHVDGKSVSVSIEGSQDIGNLYFRCMSGDKNRRIGLLFLPQEFGFTTMNFVGKKAKDLVRTMRTSANFSDEIDPFVDDKGDAFLLFPIYSGVDGVSFLDDNCSCSGFWGGSKDCCDGTSLRLSVLM